MKEDQKRKHLRRQNIISALIIIVGTILSYLIFGPHNIKSQDSEVASPETAAIVKTITLGEEESQTATLERTVFFSSVDEAEVVTEYSGRIEKVLFEIGDRVEEGDVLAIFSQTREQNAPLADLKTAQATLNLAQDSLAKTRELVDESNDIAENSVDIAEAQLKEVKESGDRNAISVAEKQLDNAEDQKDQTEESGKLQTNNAELQVTLSEGGLKLARIAYEKTIIKAPITGTVVSKEITESEYLNSGTNIAQIVGQGILKAEVDLNSSQISRISVGDDVTIDFSGTNYKGEIVSFSPIAASANQRFAVKIVTQEQIPQEANRSAKIYLSLSLDSKRPNSFFVPLEAVNIGQQKNTLLVAVEGEAVLKEVKIGETIGTEIEIVEGLEAGEQVIVENSRNLQDGQPIEIEN